VLDQRIKQIMQALGLTQAGLARELGITVDRVKSITRGKATKLHQAEAKTLVEKLHVRGDFLATGQLPVLQSPSEEEFERRLDLLRRASQSVQSLEIPEQYKRPARDLIVGAAMHDSAVVMGAIDMLADARVEERGLYPGRGQSSRGSVHDRDESAASPPNKPSE
jgi:transcriptional regulator with XRE-family HTH domain